MWTSAVRLQATCQRTSCTFLLAAYKFKRDNVYIPENCSCHFIGILSCFFLVLC